MTAEIAQASLRRLAGRGGGGDDQVKGNEDRGGEETASKHMAMAIGHGYKLNMYIYIN